MKADALDKYAVLGDAGNGVWLLDLTTVCASLYSAVGCFFRIMIIMCMDIVCSKKFMRVWYIDMTVEMMFLTRVRESG